MNRAFAETLQCSNMTVLERQSARLKWQHPEQQESYFSDLSGLFSTQTSTTHVQGFQDGLISGDDSVFDDSVMTQQVKPDPGLETAWPELGVIGPCEYGFEMNYGISRTSSCPPAVAAATVATAAVEVKGKESAVGRESFKKRKAYKLQNSKVVADDESKKIKACGEEDGESKITGQPSTKKEISAENSKVTEVQKPDYIHVRARRGQATDSHSLAERVRREKISERMKYLQDLVPGCNKITGKAGMLDEIINYVQSLQRQVEFLSMKLAAVNPRLDFNNDNLFAEDVIPSCMTNFPTLGMSSEMANPPCVQFNQVQQVVSCSGAEMGLNSPDITLRRTISAPVAIPDASFLDQQFAMQQIQPSPAWDVELQTVYNVAFDHGRSTTPFPSQPFPGSIEASHLKMEM